MREIPDMLGLTLDEVMALPETEGLAFHIQETKPIGKAQSNRKANNHNLISREGMWRVIRVLEKEDNIELTVCKV